jgi:hypothetical protein
MKEIPLTKGKVALIDDEDLQRVNQLNWYCNEYGYAIHRNGPKSKHPGTIRMHRLIMHAPSNMEVDHIDGNPLNNQKSNLRLCLHQQNGRNMKKWRKPTTSPFKGVHWNSLRRTWNVQIKVNYQVIHIGVFDCPVRAAEAYDDAAKRYFGNFAKLNFPDRQMAGSI